MRIALTGGIACGKSLVARFLNEFGVATIDADDIVHGLIPDPAERRRIAAEVFADESKRKALEARLHPLVKERIEEFLAVPAASRREALAGGAGARGRAPCGVAVIPLLFETHWDAEYDIICCVQSERETQIARMMTTRGYSRAAAEARLAAQLPVAEKAARSHYVIPNDGSLAELEAEVTRFADWLMAKVR